MYTEAQPFRIPSWIPSVLEDSPTDYLGTSGYSFDLGAKDVLLVIGHIHDDEFDGLRGLHTNLLDENVWVQGGTPSSFNLKQNIGNCIDATLCPKFNINDWKPVLDLYPNLLKRMRAFQIGGFFSTRLPSMVRVDERMGLTMDSFYRQFNLSSIVQNGKILQFEKEVLENAGDYAKVQHTLQQISATVQADMDDVTCFQTVMRAYSNNGPWNDCMLVSALTDSLLSVIPKYAPLVINEYDCYATHRMFRHYAGIGDELEPAFHMDCIQSSLRFMNGQHSPDHQSYFKRLHDGFVGRRILVLHDLGLDPMCDDWLAISLILSVLTG